MRILVIGGSVFLGRAVVEEALARGHDVTMFNRGVSRADRPDVESVHGDRENHDHLVRLVDGREWDAVVDVCGYTPAKVLDGVRVLNGHASHYTFISSISAYKGFPGEIGVNEESEQFPGDPEATEGDYGPLKSGCELAVSENFEGGTLIVQPGLILGPHENVGRLPWWLTRIERGGRVVAPGNPDREMQLIDARDIAAFTIAQVEKGTTGKFLTGGVPANTTYGQWLRDCVEVTGSDAELVWVDDAVLHEHGAQMWTEFPLWADDSMPGVWLTDSSKARAAGLTCRPVSETVRDTWEWLRHVPVGERVFGARFAHGIDPDKEAAILADWDNRS
ncbi:NAD-dependent epimerase/dehydratase family protein [Herbidospora yilanensis]|uniref:NAD-dependent epimerase/dehydratase family protein n=1 Tax=Herbidospora yilanensis TaxID=354426 RepID=UPI000785C723|nr:NAD-dependent epimerase/dehydratase family protein [Herbidospora yilanensis]